MVQLAKTLLLVFGFIFCIGVMLFCVNQLLYAESMCFSPRLTFGVFITSIIAGIISFRYLYKAIE